MEEVDDTSVPVPANSDPTEKPTIPAADQTKLEQIAEGYSIMQKGLFFVVILSCVAIYLRITGKKEKRFAEKSMV
jgi:hypothetical protein